MKSLSTTILSMILLLACVMVGAQSLPSHSTEFKGMWVTKFRTNVLGNVAAENELLTYAQTYGFNYLICTNMYQILTEDCGDFSTEMENLKLFIEKAHNVYGIQKISGNVGSAATASKVAAYNNCASVSDDQKFDMITYECEFYNSSTNGSCPGYASFISQLNTIKSICTSTDGSSPGQDLVCEVYIGGSGSTGHVITNSSESEMKTIASTADHILLTYYRSTPFSSGGNFFNWTIQRLDWLASDGGSPNNIVLLFKSRNSDSNNMFTYLNSYPGSHSAAIKDPYYSWTEGSAYNSDLTAGYVEKYEDGTYPWLSGIKVKGYTWFENEANQSMVTLPLEILHFSAVDQKDKTVVLDWDVNSTVPLQSIDLQRSAEGILWTNIAQIKTDEVTGTYVDQLPENPISYYRLKLTTMDYKNQYSDTKEVHFASQQQEISISPNPSQGHYQIRDLIINESYSVKMFNQAGQVVSEQFYEKVGQSINVNTTQNPISGIYFLQIQSSTGLVDWKKMVVMP